MTNFQKNGINNKDYLLRPLGQAVKTPPSQGGIMGSIPVGVTTLDEKVNLFHLFLLFFKLIVPALCASFELEAKSEKSTFPHFHTKKCVEGISR